MLDDLADLEKAENIFEEGCPVLTGLKRNSRRDLDCETTLAVEADVETLTAMFPQVDHAAGCFRTVLFHCVSAFRVFTYLRWSNEYAMCRSRRELLDNIGVPSFFFQSAFHRKSVSRQPRTGRINFGCGYHRAYRPQN